MYAFGVTVLLGLALVTVVNTVEHIVPATKQYRALVTLVLAIAGAIAIDFSLFEQFGIELRNANVGTWATGVIVAGSTTVWRTALAYFGSSEAGTEASAPSRPRIAA